MPGSDASPGLAPPTLEFFRVEARAPKIVPASAKRAWMDAAAHRFAYRCTPMTIANASGWEMLVPFDFEAVWDGGDSVEAITVLTRADGSAVEALVASHFGHGILTFHTGWLLRTAPGWATWTRGSPNWPRHGIIPLDGLVETEWLPFTFTMNWRFTAPGRVRFVTGEPFCFVTPVPHVALDSVQPVICDLDEEPVLAANYRRWQQSRADFNDRLRSNDREAVREGWQRGYIRGEDAAEQQATHLTRRALKPPQ